MLRNRPERRCASSFLALKCREKSFVKRLRGEADLPLLFYCSMSKGNSRIKQLFSFDFRYSNKKMALDTVIFEIFLSRIIPSNKNRFCLFQKKRALKKTESFVFMSPVESR